MRSGSAPSSRRGGTLIDRRATLDHWLSLDWVDAVQIEEVPLTPFWVCTANSDYEITALGSGARDVLVRGGQFFPERTRAQLSGSSLGGTFLKIGVIAVGFRMELRHDGRFIVTTPVVSIAPLGAGCSIHA